MKKKEKPDPFSKEEKEPGGKKRLLNAADHQSPLSVLSQWSQYFSFRRLRPIHAGSHMPTVQSVMIR